MNELARRQAMNDQLASSRFRLRGSERNVATNSMARLSRVTSRVPRSTHRPARTISRTSRTLAKRFIREGNSLASPVKILADHDDAFGLWRLATSRVDLSKVCGARSMISRCSIDTTPELIRRIASRTLIAVSATWHATCIATRRSRCRPAPLTASPSRSLSLPSRSLSLPSRSLSRTARSLSLSKRPALRQAQGPTASPRSLSERSETKRPDPGEDTDARS